MDGAIKKITYYLIIAWALLARPVRAEEIKEFTALIKIASDSSVSVVENIGYDFGVSAGYGIYRYLPSNASEIEVPEYQFAKNENKQRIELKIGDGVQALSGLNFYGINYLVQRAISYQENVDEFYWNVTGNGWPVNIKLAKAELDLPKALPEEQVKAFCYAGGVGVTTSCANLQLVRNGAGLVTGLQVEQKNLGPHESLSLRIAWPKGVVDSPGAMEKIGDFLKKAWWVILILIVFTATWKWRKILVNKFKN